MYQVNVLQGSGGAMYRFFIEEGEHNYSAYVPDLPGCVATGRTHEEIERNMPEAIVMYLEGMIEDRELIPTAQTSAQYVDVSLLHSVA